MEIKTEADADKIYGQNKIIGDVLGFKPKIEYSVGKEDWVCYSPSNIGDYFTDSHSQKMECERWIADQNKRFPNSDHANCEVKKFEFYPSFHSDWNPLMKAVAVLNLRGYSVKFQLDIDMVYEEVANYCIELSNKPAA